MEPHETGLSHYYYHQPHPPSTPTALPPNANGAVSSGVPTSAASPASNGDLFSNHGVESSDGANTTAALYPQLVAGKAPTPPSDIVRKKRGRPRKYGTPEAAAAVKAAASAARSPNSLYSPPRPTTSSRKRGHHVIGSLPSASSSKKSQLDFEAKTGQCFMPHVVTIQPGEDVAHKIRILVQQSNWELCILSASGSVCNVSLLQPATSGGSVTYDGPLDILSLSGSFVRTDHGERSGGLSACFSATNGQIVGGGLAGPLIAVGLVEVLVATFVINAKKDVSAGPKGETSTTTLASPPNSVSVSIGCYRPVIDQSGRYPVQGDDNHRGFMIQHQGLHTVPSHSDWRGGPDTRNGFNYDFTGGTGQGIHESPENVDYDI